MATQGYWTEGKVVNGTNVGGGVYIPAGSSTPSGGAPASNSGGNPTLPEYGAAGRGEWADTPGVDGRTMSDSIALGVPMSEAGNFLSEKNYVIPAGKYSGQSASSAMQYSAMEQAQIKATNDRLAKEEAAKEVIKANQRSQMSPLASYSFSPDTIAGVKNTIKSFQLTLDGIKNDPWSSAQTKSDKGTSIIEATASQLGKSFASADELNAAYQSNPDIQKSINAYIQAGGDLNNVISKIPQTKTQPAPTPAPTTGKNEMSTVDYIQSINGVDNSAPSQQAEKDLFIEGTLAKDRIAQVANIPQNLKKYYFGDDQTIGVLQQTKLQAEETIRNIEQKLNTQEVAVRQRGQFEMDKISAELAKSQATVEENRLNAKNYMTGMLAKLGALNTSGEAPVAIATIDQKYQKQSQDLYSNAQLAIRSVQLDMSEKINDIESKSDDLILKIKNDLTKSTQDVAKEIMKAQQDADRDTYSVVQSYASKLRTKTDAYEKAAKKLSSDYISEFNSLASQGFDYKQIASVLGTNTPKPMNTSGQYALAGSVPADLLDRVVQTVITEGLTLSQLYSRYPNISKAALNQIWNQISTKNEGAASAKGEKYTELADGTWRVTQPDGTSYISQTDPRNGGGDSSSMSDQEFLNLLK